LTFPLNSSIGENVQDKGMGTANEGELTPADVGMPKDEVPLPPEESTGGMPPFSPEAHDIPGPAPNSTHPFQTDALPPDPEMVNMLITIERMKELWTRADVAKNELDTKVHTMDLARSLLDQIKYGHYYLMAGGGYFEEAERQFNEAEFRISQNFLSRKWSQTVGIPLFIYEVVFAAAFIVLFMSLTTPVFSSFSEGMCAA
jgi:hypothetical protein